MEPAVSAVVGVWEAGLKQSLGDRALALLELAHEPLRSPDLLPAGARDAVLLRIRRDMIGDRIDAVVRCDACGEQLDVTLSAGELLEADIPVARAAVSIAFDGYEVDMRVPTSVDLANLRRARDVERGVAYLLRQCIAKAEHDGRAIRIDELPPAVADALDEALSAADPNGNTTLAVVCPACGTTSLAIFDIPSILWREVQGLARGALRDVHLLARAYGWSESAIFALSPARRRFYLEAIEA